MFLVACNMQKVKLLWIVEGGGDMRRIYMILVMFAGLMIIFSYRGALSKTLDGVAQEFDGTKYGVCMYAGTELVKIEPLIDDKGITHNVFCRCGELDRGNVDSSKCDMLYPCSMSENGSQCSRGFEALPAGGICADLSVNGTAELYCVVSK
jgi:hypothetical protein